MFTWNRPDILWCSSTLLFNW
jgi:hypothetical protein